jgi:hypothetical protein
MTALDGMRMKITLTGQSSNKLHFFLCYILERKLILFYGLDINDGKQAQAADKE